MKQFCLRYDFQTLNMDGSTESCGYIFNVNDDSVYIDRYQDGKQINIGFYMTSNSDYGGYIEMGREIKIERARDIWKYLKREFSFKNAKFEDVCYLLNKEEANVNNQMFRKTQMR